jgi:membrane protein DedA with SNARE-associated domain
MPMPAPPLPGVLETLAPLLNNYGYFAVGGLVTLEDFGVPVPGETILIAASVYAGAGRLSVGIVGIVGLLAAIVGDNIGYAIGRFGGRALVLRYGRYVFITRDRLATAEGFFTRHGGWIVTVARFIEGLRQANGIIAGITRMHWLKFVAFNALGAALWVGLWTSLGYLSGRNIGTIYSYATRYSLYLLVALAVLVAALIARRVLRHRHRASAPERPGNDPPNDPPDRAGEPGRDLP